MQERLLIPRVLKSLRGIPTSWWYKIPDTSRCHSCGTLLPANKRPFDVVGMYCRNLIALEFKSEHGRLSPHQRENLSFITKRGGRSFVIFPDDTFVVSPDGEITIVAETENFAEYLENTIV